MTNIEKYINSLPDDALKMAAKHYVWNKIHGKSLRAIAKATGVNPSTVMRHVHKIMHARSHPKVEIAIQHVRLTDDADGLTNEQDMTSAKRLLKQKSTVMAMSQEMGQAVIFGHGPDGRLHKLASISRDVALVLVSRGELRAQHKGRITQYVHVKPDQPALWQAGCEESTSATMSDAIPVRGENALDTLSRRKGTNGVPFLSRDLVLAGRRLNEDFVLSGCQSAIEDNFEKFLISQFDPVDLAHDALALMRFKHAVQDLGPGLADIAVRSCCLNEGIERSESAMGWSARSGKIVLRIALQRLKRHYHIVHGAGGGQIG